jgi:hypothetical protein
MRSAGIGHYVTRYISRCDLAAAALSAVQSEFSVLYQILQTHFGTAVLVRSCWNLIRERGDPQLIRMMAALWFLQIWPFALIS